jgi:hypothetical protein
MVSLLIEPRIFTHELTVHGGDKVVQLTRPHNIGTKGELSESSSDPLHRIV